ncbi:hypothetical protein pb186bvf_018047 [Paramecium bursaria]
MSANINFLTEINLPTLQSYDVSQAKKLKEICKDMEELMGQTQEKIRTIMQQQQGKFFQAFRNVIEKMFKEFQDLQKKFEDYIAFHENETEVFNAQSKLAFFRKECQLLNSLCKNLKQENQQLKLKIEDLQNELSYEHKVLIKQTALKNDLQSQLMRYSVENKTASPQRGRIRLKSNTESLLDNPNQNSTKNRQIAIRKVLQTISSQNPDKPEAAITSTKANMLESFYYKSYQSKSQARQKTQEIDTTIKTHKQVESDKKYYSNDVQVSIF